MNVTNRLESFIGGKRLFENIYSGDVEMDQRKEICRRTNAEFSEKCSVGISCSFMCIRYSNNLCPVVAVVGGIVRFLNSHECRFVLFSPKISCVYAGIFAGYVDIVYTICRCNVYGRQSITIHIY